MVWTTAKGVTALKMSWAPDPEPDGLDEGKGRERGPGRLTRTRHAGVAVSGGGKSQGVNILGSDEWSRGRNDKFGVTSTRMAHKAEGLEGLARERLGRERGIW